MQLPMLKKIGEDLAIDLESIAKPQDGKKS